MQRLISLFVIAALLSLAGCSALSPYSNYTKLELNLSGSSGLNPDISNRPSPIVVRLMELKHPVAFENADFFSLYERPKEALSPDLVALEELELRPGENRQLKLTVNEGSRYVGVFAAYRDLPETEWQFIIPLQDKALNQVNLRLDEQGIHAVSDAVAGKD
ncbi:type VI secretion system lipoprotein TssJ [Pseudomonas sp. S9]|uniref:type VI secretion system lipoprotein TssJ n=1 Tax=Pseudomonas sp. S9 TaxID=686578 RepID=UPI0002556AD3|nr:type VI secretion system lipoprotein TssJ [Pseudomonas sp. S9]